MCVGWSLIDRLIDWLTSFDGPLHGSMCFFAEAVILIACSRESVTECPQPFRRSFHGAFFAWFVPVESLHFFCVWIRDRCCEVCFIAYSGGLTGNSENQTMLSKVWRQSTYLKVFATALNTMHEKIPLGCWGQSNFPNVCVSNRQATCCYWSNAIMIMKLLYQNSILPVRLDDLAIVGMQTLTQ